MCPGLRVPGHVDPHPQVLFGVAGIHSRLGVVPDPRVLQHDRQRAIW